jgi:tetratricopeptide (TPR) repeat protein
MTHYDDRLLAALRRNELPPHRAAEVRAHVAACDVCRERAEALTNVVAFERDRRGAESRRAELRETARRLMRERSDAGELVGRMLQATERDEWPGLASKEELRNIGAVEQFIVEVQFRMEREPREALTLSNIATTIAETLRNDLYPPVVLAQLRAQAWKARANALRYLGRYGDALEAVDRADERLANFATVAHDRALVQLARAIILFQTTRFSEALALLTECRIVFSDHGDARSALSCGIVEGNVLYEQKRYRDATAAFTPLIVEARDLGDIESEARLHNNLGYCATHLGHTSAANVHFSEAIARFRDLGLDAEATRTQRGAGTLLIARGALFAGLAYLADARATLAAHGMIEEAGLCGLRIAEALIGRGDHREAARVAGDVAREFSAAGIDHRVVEALEQLRSAIDAAEASPENVRQLHDYIVHRRNEVARQSTAM